MSPFQVVTDLELLARCHTRFLRVEDIGADCEGVAQMRAVKRLMDAGLIAIIEDKPNAPLTTTKKGAAMIDALMSVPEPVARESWADPRTGQEIKPWTPARDALAESIASQIEAGVPVPGAPR